MGRKGTPRGYYMAKNGLKFCVRCGEQKPVEFFPKHRSTPDGYSYYCKSCYMLLPSYQESKRRWRESGRWAEYNRARRTAKGCGTHASPGSRMAKDGMKTCSRCNVTKPVSEFRRHRGRPDGYDYICKQCKSEVDKRYYKRNREKIITRVKDNYWQNPEESRKKRRLWTQRNREHVRQWWKQWYSTHSVHRRQKIRIRYMAVGSSTITDEQTWKMILETFSYRCAYCGKEGIPLTIDHWIPVTKGGTNDPWNLVPSCKSCNSSKGNRTPLEWLDILKLRGVGDEQISELLSRLRSIGQRFGCGDMPLV